MLDAEPLNPRPSGSDSPAFLTMEGLVAKVLAEPNLPQSRKTNLASSIRRFCRALSYELADAPATFEFFRSRLKSFHPLTAGIKPKRWQTIRSDVSFALKLAGVGQAKRASHSPLTPEWLALKQSGAKRFHWGLSRLARFCAERGIGPTAVDDKVMDAYAGTLQRETFKANPAALHRDVCQLWNKMAALPGLQLQRCP
jgi:hypothetical protein